MTNAPRLTDRNALELHRQRALQSPETFLFEDVAAEVEERLAEVKKAFTKPLIICGANTFDGAALQAAPRIPDAPELAVTRQAHDLILHWMALHWADDPVGQLVQSRLALQPDGLFLGAMFGGQTLQELRTALAEAETKITGGLSPRVLPMADLRDLGGLLQRAGFALPVADSRTVTVRYSSLAALVKDLRGMGETNALAARLRHPTRRAVFAEAERLYRTHFSDTDDYLTATFELVFLTGWAPDDSQPQPLRPGSATTRLADALGTEEKPTGDTVAPRER